MTDIIWVALIGSLLGPLATLIVGHLLNVKIKHVAVDAKASRTQVQNSHETNLRDDLDEKFGTVLETVTEARDHAKEAAREAARANNRLDRQGAEIGGLKKRLDRHIDG